MSSKLFNIIPHLSYALGDKVNINDWISDSIDCDRSTAYRKVHGISKMTCEELFSIIENSPGGTAINYPLFERSNFSIIQSFQIKSENDLWFYLIEFCELLEYQVLNKGNIKCNGDRLPFFLFFCNDLLFRYYRYQTLGIPFSESLDDRFGRKIEQIKEYVDEIPVFASNLKVKFEKEIFGFHSLLTTDIINKELNVELGKVLSESLNSITSTVKLNRRVGLPSEKAVFEEILCDNMKNGIVIQKQAESHFLHSSHSDFKEMFLKKWNF